MQRPNAMNRLASAENGFTMVTVLLAMMVLSLLSIGAYAASMGDMPVARKDQDRKRAYEAAQAGVDWYMSMLRADPDFWETCAPSSPTTAVPLTLEGAASNTWHTVDSGPYPSKFRVEILNGTAGTVPTPCDDDNPGATALDKQGRLWIRATGTANGKVRSVLAALYQKSEFLQYLLFTNWESQDPQLANATLNWKPGGGPSNVSQCDYPGLTRDQGPPNQLGQIVCVTTQYRAADKFLGSIHTNDDGIKNCGAQFGETPSDTLEVASAPAPNNWNSSNAFRTYTVPHVWAGYLCDGIPSDDPIATVKAPAPVKQLPPSNVRLMKLADTLGSAALTLYGQSCIEFLSDGRMKIYEAPGSANAHRAWGIGAGTQADPKAVSCEEDKPGVSNPNPARYENVPESGLVVVKNKTGEICTPRMGHNATTSYSSSTGCGDVAVKGTYAGRLTIAAENDVIITGNLERAEHDAMVGLIGNGFIRLYHPMTEDPIREANQEGKEEPDGSGQCFLPFLGACLKEYTTWHCSGATPGWVRPQGRMREVATFTPVTKVQAAVLSMRHAFIVDNLMCGPPLSAPLEFEGSITTYWGMQVHGCAPPILVDPAYACAGYPARNWKYDQRLKTQQPPHFIAPLNSDGRWQINRRTEQVPTPVPAPSP